MSPPSAIVERTALGQEFPSMLQVCRRPFLLAAWASVAVTLAAGAAPATESKAPKDPALVRAERVLDRAILFDGHNDLPITLRSEFGPVPDPAQYDLRQRTRWQTDIPRLRAGRVGAQFWSVYIPGEAGRDFARTQLEQIATARRMIEKYPDVFEYASTADDVVRIRRAGRIASMLGMEGGYGIENSLGPLKAYYDLGVRYMALTHNTHTDWADSAAQVPARHGGLSDFGREVVREMNRLGMLIDLSHASEETVLDTLDVSQAPVIFSHSAVRGIVDIPRNVPDFALDRLKANGGVVMVLFVGGFVSPEAAKAWAPAMAEFQFRAREAKTPQERSALFREVFDKANIPKPTIAQVADHIEYVVRRAGIDHVGIGADYDGASGWPDGLSDVSTYPNLFAELVRRGWSDRDLEKLAGGNVLRALRAAERLAARQQADAFKGAPRQ
ncbi:MAG: dipeptidase [Pseudomonadota bacterium]